MPQFITRPRTRKVTSYAPNDRLERLGPMAVRDAELLGVVIGKPDRAEMILSDYPKESLVDMSLEQLVRIEGVSKAKARTLIAAFELARRGLHRDLGVRPVISAPGDSLHYLTDIRDQQREHFLCLYPPKRGFRLTGRTADRSYHTNRGNHPMTTKDLNRIAETAEQARRVGEKVKEIWTRRNALCAIRDAKDPHTEAHRRFCNSESEFRSVIDMCKEPHFKRSNLNPLINYYTGWAKMKEAHRDDLLAQLQELVANPTQEEDKPHDE